MSQENPFGPRKINMQELFLNSLGSFIAGIIGSLIIIIIMLIFWNTFNISGKIIDENLGTTTNNMFPFVLSIIGLIGTSTTMFLNYIFLRLTSPERYKKNTIITGQIAFFIVLSYIFITPLYIFAWNMSYGNIMIVFLGHTLINIFWTSIIIEVLNNYRYILTGLYGSFIGLFISIILTVMIFFYLSTWYAKLISLLFLLPLISTTTTFFKQLFELMYYKYNHFSNLDQLGDIFYQIEIQEKQDFQEAIEKDTI